jgi:hypothetical protein
VAIAPMPRATSASLPAGRTPCAPRPAAAGTSTKLAAANSTAWPANSQNTPRHRPASANSPPTSGPAKVATPHTLVASAKTRGRWRPGNISASAT